MRARWIRAATVVLAASVCGGCYEYTPVDFDRVPADAAVRVRMSVSGMERLRSRLGSDAQSGPRRGTELDARVVAGDAQRVLLSIPWSRTGDIYASKVLRQEVDLPWGDILEIRLRQLNRTKTGVLAGALAVAAGVTVYKVITGWTGGPTGPNGDSGTVEAVIPVFRLRWGF